MGVKGLWKILSKAKRKVDVKELRGKTLAVDLSCWICQFSSVKGTCGTHEDGLSCVKCMDGMSSPLNSQLTEEPLLPYPTSLLCWS